MQYKKITLALILLASSALVSAASNSGSDETLVAQIFAKVDGQTLKAEALEGLNLKQYQIDALVEAKELVDAAAVKVVLEAAVDPETSSSGNETPKGTDDTEASGSGNETAKGTVDPETSSSGNETPKGTDDTEAPGSGNETAKGTVDPEASSSGDETVESKIAALLAKGPLNKESLADFQLKDYQINALQAATGLTDAASVKAVLDLPKPNAAPESKSNIQDTADKILEAAVVNGKLNNAEELKKFDLTPAQIAALSVPDLEITKAVIEKILAPSAPVVTAEETVDSKVKALASLIKEGKIEALSPEIIKKHNITSEQVNALKAASDLTEDSIKKILSADVQPIGSNNDKEIGDVKWYTQTWVMILGSAVVLCGLGGGIYMMTRKSDETDL